MWKPTLLFLTILTVGCDVRPERFEPNRVFELTLATSRQVQLETAGRDVSAVVDELFGSPYQPNWPAETLGSELATLVSLEKLIQCAGSVASDEQNRHKGLFLEHCATCHALNGSGTGPASLLQNPYPRDFRPGVMKWKSTPRADKPTKDDLSTLLQNGVPGTAMPSFANVDAVDRDALVDYIVYLSIRGEVERRLLSACESVIGYDDADPLPDDDRLTTDSPLVAQTLIRVATEWKDAQPVNIPSPPNNQAADERSASVDRGKQIFHSQIANCSGCHGPEGNGQAVILDYDDWTKEFTTRLGITPTDRDDVKPFRKAGALRPRKIDPRNLRDGVFRGGGDSRTLFQRISQGIAGTPMPGVEIASEPNGKGLTEQQAWDLIHYVQHLGNRTH